MTDMKTDISYLPQKKQDELRAIAQAVRSEIHNCEMVILYGSYATGDFVELDEQVEYGVRTWYKSDFDILVITTKAPTEITERKLAAIDKQFDTRMNTPIDFIAIDIQEMNKCIQAGRSFHIGIVKEGILLYDSGNFVLTEGRALNHREILEEARSYFDDKFDRGNSFIRSARHAYDDNDYRLMAFDLHQACEFFFIGIILTYTLSNLKVHDLGKLLRISLKYVPSLDRLFPENTKEERYIFNLLKKAYKEARYNKKFIPTEEEVLAQLAMAERLRDLTEEVCTERIAYYTKLAEENPEGGKFYTEEEMSSVLRDMGSDMRDDKDHYRKPEEKEE